MKLRLTQLLAILLLAATRTLQANPPAPNTFTLTGSMNVPREDHITVLLNNGQVLAVTGDDTGANTAELYNPATGTWTVTGTPVMFHELGSATLLANGQVLLAGGVNPNLSDELVAGAELYNPATGQWTVTGSLPSARDFQSAVLLPNGQVLVAGGVSSGGVLADAELYDPATGTWQPTTSMHQARTMALAELLDNGTVLVAGGSDGTKLTSAEIYNPSTAEWTTVANMPTNSNSNGRGALLPNGDVLAARDAFFNPATGTWTATPLLPTSRHLLGPFTATALTTDQVLLTGFELDYNETPTESYTFLYNFATNGYAASAPMNTTRWANAAVLLSNGQVLVSGGFRKGFGNAPVVLSSAELYTP